jgi:hypothetical protein
MFARLHIRKAFYLRIATVLLSALFVISAYLFFSIPQPSVVSQSGQKNYPESRDDVVMDAGFAFETSEDPPPPMRNVKSSMDADSMTDDESVSILLSQLLEDYHSHDLEQDQKRAIRKVLSEINASPEGRALMADFFFHEQNPEMSASMYDMILDAGLKDVTLITELIDRDKTEYRLDFKIRLIDLIADHNTLEQPYSQKIGDFLAEMTVHTDEHVKLAAISQWAWYENKHKGILPVLNAYLLSPSPMVRQEIYEMIGLHVIQDDSQKREVLLALDSLQYADYLGLSDEEKIQIQKLKLELAP